MRGDSNLLDLAAKELVQLHAGVAVPEGKLETGRPGVEGQDTAGHIHSIGYASVAGTGRGLVRPAPILDFGHVFAVLVHITAMLG